MDNNRKQKAVKVITMVSGLAQSKTNMLIFKDDPWVWAMYYTGIFMEMPTVIVIEEDNRRFIKRLENPLVKAFIRVKKHDHKSSGEVAQRMIELREKGII